MSASDVVRLEHAGAIATVTIDHPPVNALNAAVVEGLEAAFGSLLDDETRVVVVRGAGEKAFVAGADITEFPSIATREDVLHGLRLPDVLADIARCSKPTIAQISGYCLGGGLELAMACDLRVAAEDALLGQPEIKLGLIPGAGGTQRLPRLVGRSRALLLNLVGDPISGAEAYAWGLVDRVVAPAALPAVVAEMAERIAAQSPRAVAALKELHVSTAETPLAGGLAREAAAFADCLVGAEGREGVRAFLAKRPPQWDAA